MHSFDAEQSAKARDEAIAQAEEAADLLWRMQAFNAVEYVARRRPFFTTDAVWYVLGLMGALPPREPRAMGAIMTRCKSKAVGMVEPTPEFRPSVRVCAHRKPQRVWKSKLI